VRVRTVSGAPSMTKWSVHDDLHVVAPYPEGAGVVPAGWLRHDARRL